MGSVWKLASTPQRAQQLLSLKWKTALPRRMLLLLPTGSASSIKDESSRMIEHCRTMILQTALPCSWSKQLLLQQVPVLHPLRLRRCPVTRLPVRIPRERLYLNRQMLSTITPLLLLVAVAAVVSTPLPPWWLITVTMATLLVERRSRILSNCKKWWTLPWCKDCSITHKWWAISSNSPWTLHSTFLLFVHLYCLLLS